MRPTPALRAAASNALKVSSLLSVTSSPIASRTGIAFTIFLQPRVSGRSDRPPIGRGRSGRRVDEYVRGFSGETARIQRDVVANDATADLGGVSDIVLVGNRWRDALL